MDNEYEAMGAVVQDIWHEIQDMENRRAPVRELAAAWRMAANICYGYALVFARLGRDSERLTFAWLHDIAVLRLDMVAGAGDLQSRIQLVRDLREASRLQ